MATSKNYYIIGNKNGLKKTIAAFKLYPDEIVFSFVRAPDTIRGTKEPYYEHFTYHRTGIIEHTILKNNKPVNKMDYKQISPIESIGAPELITNGEEHFLDFEGIDIKQYDHKRARVDIIVLDTKGCNYLGFHIKIWIAGHDDLSVPSDYDGGDLRRLCGDGPQILLSIIRRDGLKVKFRN